MRKAIKKDRYDETLHISKCHDGFWLYDTTRGMNLSMRSKSKDEAFFNALKYYQRRLLTVEQELNTLKGRVNLFITDIYPEIDTYNY